MPGQTLFIHEEQGFGDTFQCLRVVPWVKASSGAKIMLELRPEMVPFAERMGGIDWKTVAYTVAAELKRRFTL